MLWFVRHLVSFVQHCKTHTGCVLILVFVSFSHRHIAAIHQRNGVIDRYGERSEAAVVSCIMFPCLLNIAHRSQLTTDTVIDRAGFAATFKYAAGRPRNFLWVHFCRKLPCNLYHQVRFTLLTAITLCHYCVLIGVLERVCFD